MTITRISHMHGCGIFRDFSWPADLSNFSRYNLIYGWNGSGKTTLSRLFRALETRASTGSGQVTFAINGKDVSTDGFAQVTLPVRVFNRDFVMESVFPVGGGELPPIFVVGRESVQRQKQIEQLKNELAKAQSVLESARSKRQENESALDKFCVEKARVIRDTLRSPGSNPFNNYTKSNFRARAQKMATDSDRESHQLDESDRESLLVKQRAIRKPKVPVVRYRFPNLRQLTSTVSDLLSTTVVSATIQSLKNDPTLSAWVHQGLELHEARRADACLFCEQPLPKDRLTTLEAHFNNEYEQFVKKIDMQIAQLEEAWKATTALALPNRAEFYEDLVAQYEAAESSLRQAADSTRTILELLMQVLTIKKGRVFESLSLDVSFLEAGIGLDFMKATIEAAPGESESDFDAIERVNEVIRKHNHACDDFDVRVRDARQRLEAAWVAETLEEFMELEEAVRQAETLVDEETAEVARLQLQIGRLEKEILEHRRPAEELNLDLRTYLGHDELRLEAKDTGYTITRNGQPAYSLSEGEMTAIALLYFLKSLNDRRFELSRGLVVLDDPVSSLDANALYLAFGFIRQRTERAAQLVILTHNFTFFRLVRNWFSHLKDSQFYMLDSSWDHGQRCATIRALHPLLKKHESEYHYLFFRIYCEARGTTQSGLEENYALPNMARRLLETFLAFRQPHMSGHLWQQLQAVQFDEAKKLRIYRFLNAYSHGDAVEEPEHDLSLLAEARSVSADLLDLIHSEDPGHFLAMETVMKKLMVPEANERKDL